jgi:protein-disulfide isomerase
MKTVIKAFLVVFILAAGFGAARADDDHRIAALMSERVLGKANAPVKVDEYISLACSHCADFYTKVLPDLEKKYIDTGKVKFVIHDFPLDGASLKAAAVARCMPADEFFPYVKILYSAQDKWAYGNPNPEATIVQYAKLGGLPEDKAKACANDSALQDAIVAERTEAGKVNVEATPTFILNDGAETIKGAQSVEVFSAAFDRLLAAKK